METCLDVLEGIRHEIHRRGLTQPTKVRELAEEFIAYFAGLRDSTFGGGECAMLTAEGEACETKVRLEAGCNASSCARHFGKTMVAMFLRCKGFRDFPEPQAITTPCGVCNHAVEPEEMCVCRLCAVMFHGSCVMRQLSGAGWNTEEWHGVMCSRCVVLRFPETLLISAHGNQRGRQQLGMVVLRAESWSEDARDTWETAGVREQIEAHFFLAPSVTRVLPGTPGQAAARGAQAVGASPLVGGGRWAVQPAPTPVGGGSLASPVQGTPGVYRAPNRMPLAAPLPPPPAQPVGGGFGEASGELQEVGDSRGLGQALSLARLQEQVVSLTAIISRQGEVAPEMRFFVGTGTVRGNPFCVLGLADGFARGAVGNPSSKEAFVRVNYLGMNDSKTDKLKTERLVGCATLDQRVQNRGLPEEVSVGEVIPLGEGYEIRTTSKKKGVPERMLVSRYLHALAADWEGIRATGEGVYSPNHPDYAYFQCMSSLIRPRPA